LKFAQDSTSLVEARGSQIPGSFNATPSSPPIGDFSAGVGFPESNRALDVNWSYLDDIQVNLLLHATQASQRSITVTAPRITFFNGQRAYVIVARQIAFVSDLEPIPNSPGFDPTLSVTQSGVSLDVEGTISADRRYVTLTVRPSLATLATNPPRRIEQSAIFEGDDDAGVEPQVFSAFIEAPELELTTLRTTVSVPDKGTLLMGGQRLAADVEVEVGVPVLSKIPVLNRFFTNNTKVKDERTVLILVKPTIIIQSEQEEELYPGLLEDPQSYTTGQEF
jgi:type II secretory pathway component GspD/PulD (secretin)